jgi:hypothetical protein
MAKTAEPIRTRMSWEEFLTAGEEWQRRELVDFSLVTARTPCDST